MKKEKINRKKTNLFSNQQLDLSYDQASLSEFINTPFSLAAFEEVILKKKNHFSDHQRNVLSDALHQQYSLVSNKELIDNQIDLLRSENTFAITTGHQLSLLTGPLYFIYKILHVINLSEELNARYPDSKFIPVYWMATEDHDFEEIRSISVFNQLISWESEQKGPVGRFDLDGLDSVAEKVKELFKNQPESEVNEFLDQLKGVNYGSAFRKLIHWLFGEYGLLIIDGDDANLKKMFVPAMEKELLENFSSAAVEKTNTRLEKRGLKTQITAREINLFYIEKGIRERIIKENENYLIAGKGSFSPSEIIEMLHKNPESFSPNVVLRPVYQETILPNLCYVGGTGELTYWLQLKGVFDALNVPYPLIQVRNSLLWIDKSTSEKMSKVNLIKNQLFEDLHQLQRNFVDENSSVEIDFSELDKRFKSLEEELLQTVMKVDIHMDKYANAEMVRMSKQITSIKEKLFKVEKQRHDGALKNIDQIKERLFPNDGLQERSVNILQLANKGDLKNTIRILKAEIEPFEEDFIILTEE